MSTIVEEAPPAPEQTKTSILPPTTDRKAEDKVPELELTWADVRDLGLEDVAVERMILLKRKYNRILLISVGSEIYLARTCSRLEWRDVVNELSKIEEKRESLTREGKTDTAINSILTMMGEDTVVERFLVYPQKSVSDIRTQLLPGDVKHLHDSIMVGLGYGQQPRAIRV